MTRDLSSANEDSIPIDDSYWTALFEQEEASSLALSSFQNDEPWPTASNSDTKQIPKLQEHRVLKYPESDGQNPWLTAQEYLDSDKVLQLRVTGYNKGGLLIHWNGLQGFVPASQLVDFPQFHFEAERINALRSWIDNTLQLKIVEINQKLNRLILSERAALVNADQKENLLNSIASGDRLTGQITNLTNFGAFVDLGGVEGLIHISELSWSRVSHRSDVISPGQDVEVLVLNVDQNNERVALSLKQLKSDPWLTVENRYKQGQIVEGVVSKVVNFGAFVLLEEELEGLIHISELAEGTFLHPRNVVKHGDKIKAIVLSVNGPKKRLALSLRRLNSLDDGR